MPAPVFTDDGLPLFLDGSEPALADDPCDCCAGDYCDECSGALPETLSVTISGWTIPSFQPLNDTYVLTSASNCVWTGTFELEGGCGDVNGVVCDDTIGSYNYDLELTLTATGTLWRLELYILDISGVTVGYYESASFCQACLPPYGHESGGLDKSTFESSTFPCTGSVTLNDNWTPPSANFMYCADDSGDCAVATQDRPSTITLNLP